MEHYFRKPSILSLVNSTEEIVVIVVVFVFFGYQYFASFYRASAREVKRLGASELASKCRLPILIPCICIVRRFDASVVAVFASLRILDW